jgi:hypothetical protein
VRVASYFGGDDYGLPPNTLAKLVDVSGPPFEAIFHRWAHHVTPEGEAALVDRGGPEGEGEWRYYRASKPNGGAATYWPAEPINWTMPYPGLRKQRGSVEQVELPDYDPDATFRRTVNRKLFTFHVTFLAPALSRPLSVGWPKSFQEQREAVNVLARQLSHRATRHGDEVTTLNFLDRLAFVRGTEELTSGLEHSMDAEWDRGDEWEDRQGASYDARTEFGYVTGAASVKECTPGTRDTANAGMRPADFKRRVNDHIRSHCPGATRAKLLSEREVVAVRLYTGPGFAPINGWLRAVGELTPEQRRAAALDSRASYGATVGLLISAIDKLSKLNSGAATLYRGVRGVLPSSFWIPDAQGFVCATDLAFMSTSLSEETPIRYMARGGQPNVMWELECSAEDDVGYHGGAELAMLSQFAQESEVLFPPLTYMQVRRIDEVEVGQVRCVVIEVVPVIGAA